MNTVNVPRPMRMLRETGTHSGTPFHTYSVSTVSMPETAILLGHTLFIEAAPAV